MKNTYKLLALSTFTLALTGCSLSEPEYSWCQPEAVTEQISLAADALFKFDKSAKEDLLPKGRETLDELANKLTTGYVQVDKIDLVGHTDRLGSEKYNYDLGLRRAETVKAYLNDKGITAPITTASAGETQPVTKDCVGEKATKALVACLQPDRRVVVGITGVRKVEK
ncbi:OmpA family protein [Avibacterium sp. 21-594]|uniref:OmpA family protein n=1 Tax=Avibacterium sp. 21-594 TaxID=2911535 RepID=UPI002246F318|nr:OmpA family protein [Avibacterium sp. 21-594]MCW9716594.1 OmpA family protein [Avibacterium sp. 21-594]